MAVRVEIENQLRISIIFQILRKKFSIFEINFPFKIENSINFEVTKMREKNRNSKIWDDGSLRKTIIRADPYSLSRSTSIRSLHIRWKFSIFLFSIFLEMDFRWRFQSSNLEFRDLSMRNHGLVVLFYTVRYLFGDQQVVWDDFWRKWKIKWKNGKLNL